MPRKGQYGTFDTDERPMVVNDVVDPTTVRGRILGETPDDDTFGGPSPPGTSAILTPVEIADASGTSLKFTPVHAPVRYFDTDLDVFLKIPGDNELDEIWISRESSGEGPQLFLIKPDTTTPIARPMVALPARAVLQATVANEVATVPSATDIVLGADATSIPSWDRTFRFPSVLPPVWAFSNGVLSGISSGHYTAHFTVVISLSVGTPLIWEFELQRRPFLGAWTKEICLIRHELKSTVTPVTDTGFGQVLMTDDRDEFRIAFRHDSGSSQDITIERAELIINAFSIT